MAHERATVQSVESMGAETTLTKQGVRDLNTLGPRRLRPNPTVLDRAERGSKAAQSSQPPAPKRAT